MNRNISQWGCWGIRAFHSTQAADSSCHPLGGSHGLRENSLYNLLRVITSESLRDTHTLSSVVAQAPNCSGHICAVAQLCVSVCVWVFFFESFWVRCSHYATRYTKQAGWVTRDSGCFPHQSESTLYQLRWEHVTAVSSHRSLCKNQQLLSRLSSASTLSKGCDVVGVRQSQVFKQVYS